MGWRESAGGCFGEGAGGTRGARGARGAERASSRGRARTGPWRMNVALARAAASRRGRANHSRP